MPTFRTFYKVIIFSWDYHGCTLCWCIIILTYILVQSFRIIQSPWRTIPIFCNIFLPKRTTCLSPWRLSEVQWSVPVSWPFWPLSTPEHIYSPFLYGQSLFLPALSSPSIIIIFRIMMIVIIIIITFTISVIITYAK